MTRSSAPAAVKPFYIHATAVKIGKAGLLIRGPSRAGKSSLALALLAEAARLSLHGRLIGDDRISIECSDEGLLMRGHPAILGKIERRGEGILDVAWEPGAIANYVIDLSRETFESPFRSASTWMATIQLPLFTLPHGVCAAERAKLLLPLLQDVQGSCENGRRTVGNPYPQSDLSP